MTIFKVLKEFHDFLYEKKSKSRANINKRGQFKYTKRKKNSDYYSLYLKIINSN